MKPRLLLWQSTDEIKARRRDPRPGRGSINWLIDGQQRMITMARTLAGDEGIDVIFHPDGRNRTPLHELESKVVLNAWADTKRATGEALDLIRSELGLVNMSVLWSGALVVPVIALCATLAPKHRDAPGIAAWLALAALVHRYSGATETALDQDLRACRSSDPLGALLSNLRQERPSLTATPEDFEGFIADRSALLAMYIACRHRGILDFYTGAKIFMQKSIDRHHIMPRSQFDTPKRAQADRIANIAFISGDVNKSIGQAGPEVYLKSLKSKVLMSQCVPTDPGLWFVESAPEFWQTRKELLAEAFNEFVREALPNRKL